MSRGRPQGRGVGREQSLQLLDALRRSRAVQTGLLSDLGEAELFIEGIGADKISDLTSNIIRMPLLQYTKEQAELWGMPLTDDVPLAPVWDTNRDDWVQAPRQTIVVSGAPVLLVPKYAVRRQLTLNSQEFYNHHMVEYLRQEYLRADQGLAVVLRSGERKVYKIDVKERHPKSKPVLAEFAHQHPEVLAQYKKIAGAKGSLNAEEMDETFDERTYARGLITALADIPVGSRHASAYHSFCIGVLTFLFYPDLVEPVKEREIDEGRKRIDIQYTNASRSGFFDMAIRSPQMRAVKLPVECKNYSQDIANPELDQLEGRFSHVRGFLGLLCCRSLVDRGRFISRCKDAAIHRGHHILVLDDQDINALLTMIESGQRDSIDRYLIARHAELVN